MKGATVRGVVEGASVETIVVLDERTGDRLAVPRTQKQARRARGKKILKIVLGVSGTVAVIVFVTALSLPKS